MQHAWHVMHAKDIMKSAWHECPAIALSDFPLVLTRLFCIAQHSAFASLTCGSSRASGARSSAARRSAPSGPLPPEPSAPAVSDSTHAANASTSVTSRSLRGPSV
eukprot:365062-Chlamydomonas_euryale.AAC.5